jgi:hypothetical protein
MTEEYLDYGNIPCFIFHRIYVLGPEPFSILLRILWISLISAGTFLDTALQFDKNGFEFLSNSHSTLTRIICHVQEMPLNKQTPWSVRKRTIPTERPPTKQTPWPLVRERTIPIERPPLVDEI